jgi:predicted peroxiredoxin
MADVEKLVIMTTHGPEDPVRAVIPFVMGVAAVVMDVECIIGFQGTSVELLRDDTADHIEVTGFPPLRTLMDDFVEQGGKLLVCAPCVEARHLVPAEHFQYELVLAARFVAEICTATNSLVY